MQNAILTTLNMMQTYDENFLSEIEEPKTAEDYARMNPIQKLMIHMKWSYQDFGRECHDRDFMLDKLKRFNKELEVKKYHLINKGRMTTYVFDKLEDIADELNVKLDVVKYIKRYGNVELKKPKHAIQKQYKIIEVAYILSGDDYVEKV